MRGWGVGKTSYHCMDTTLIHVAAHHLYPTETGARAPENFLDYTPEPKPATNVNDIFYNKQAAVVISGTRITRDMRIIVRGADVKVVTFPKSVKKVEDGAF